MGFFNTTFQLRRRRGWLERSLARGEGEKVAEKLSCDDDDMNEGVFKCGTEREESMRNDDHYGAKEIEFVI